MTRVYLLVEGQTEETFVRELLAPHYANQGLYLRPIIVRTSTGHKGGLVSYAKVKAQIEKLCKQDSHAFVSTMFDLYALPRDFPKNANAYLEQRGGADKANFLEVALAQDINQHNFIPYIQVHEFEALLFAETQAFALWTEASVLEKLKDIAMQYANQPETINDGPTTAPSKRIQALMPSYQKPLHGALIACEIGLDKMRATCPHFANWLAKLEGIMDGNKSIMSHTAP